MSSYGDLSESFLRFIFPDSQNLHHFEKTAYTAIAIAVSAAIVFGIAMVKLFHHFQRKTEREHCREMLQKTRSEILELAKSLSVDSQNALQKVKVVDQVMAKLIVLEEFRVASRFGSLGKSQFPNEFGQLKIALREAFGQFFGSAEKVQRVINELEYLEEAYGLVPVCFKYLSRVVGPQAWIPVIFLEILPIYSGVDNGARAFKFYDYIRKEMDNVLVEQADIEQVVDTLLSNFRIDTSESPPTDNIEQVFFALTTLRRTRYTYEKMKEFISGDSHAEYIRAKAVPYLVEAYKDFIQKEDDEDKHPMLDMYHKLTRNYLNNYSIEWEKEQINFSSKPPPPLRV